MRTRKPVRRVVRLIAVAAATAGAIAAPTSLSAQPLASSVIRPEQFIKQAASITKPPQAVPLASSVIKPEQLAIQE
jgi:hypothetical protein